MIAHPIGTPIGSPIGHSESGANRSYRVVSYRVMDRPGMHSGLSTREAGHAQPAVPAARACMRGGDHG